VPSDIFSFQFSVLLQLGPLLCKLGTSYVPPSSSASPVGLSISPNTALFTLLLINTIKDGIAYYILTYKAKLILCELFNRRDLKSALAGT
jgi:hypothetical protein